MAEISLQDVSRLAELSNIQLTTEEATKLKVDLDSIVNYINQLKELDTDNVEPTYQVTGLKNVWREDEVIDYGVSREQLLSLSPSSVNNAVKVPKVL